VAQIGLGSLALPLGCEDVEDIAADQLPLLIAQQVVSRAVHHEDAAVGSDEDHDRPSDIEVLARAVALLAQRVLGAALLGDVVEDTLREQRPPVGIAHDGVLLVDPDDAPVARHHAVLDVEFLDGLEDALLLGGDAFAVVGVQQAVPEVLVGDQLFGCVAE
jgi:hypothetical protein